MKSLFISKAILILLFSFLFSFSENVLSQHTLNSFDFEKNHDFALRNVEYRLVLLFNNAKIDFDSLKPIEKSFIEPQILKPTAIHGREILKKRLSKEEVLNFDLYTQIDPVTGQPVEYTKSRLKSYYYVWRDLFIKNNKIISYFDSASHSAILYKENIANKEVYLLLNVQFKDEKIQISCENHGVVRTFENPVPTAITIGGLFTKEDDLSTSEKNKAYISYLNKINSIPLDLLNFILNEQDFIFRAESSILEYKPLFNF